MKQKPLKQPPPKTPKKPARPQVALGRKNYIIMAVGIVIVAIGFITLARGSITLAPLLLVLGYCVLIPVSLLVK
ncbi:MAG: hypothetical protein ABIL25_08430 [candidate division WOR-3 bacterium]